MAKRHVYRNDPIEEALCEVRFTTGKEWNVTMPGRFYERIKTEYQGKIRQESAIEAGVETASQTQSSAARQFKGRSARVQFPSEDGGKLVAIGPDVLTVHVLRPYPSWDDFCPRIHDAFDSYLEVAEPTGIGGISIRYINRVLLKGSSVDPEEFFTIAPKIPPTEIPLERGGFLSRVESRYRDQPVRLTTTLATVEAPEGYSAFLLDIEVARDWTQEPLPLSDAMTHVQELRERERDAFEASITNPTREVFDAE